MRKSMRPEIRRWINELKPSGNHWLCTIDDGEGQPCVRTYALNIGKKGIRCKEVFRDYLDGRKFIRGSLIWCGSGGWRVMWESRGYCLFYMPAELDDNWYKAEKRPGMCVNELYSLTTVNDMFKKYIPYFETKNGSSLSLIEYAQRYRDYTSTELLVKAGLDHMVMDKRVLKMSENSKKKFLKWLRSDNNAKYVKDHKTSYSDILKAIKREVPIERLYYEECIDTYERVFKENHLRRTREQCEKVYKYLNHQKKVQHIGLVDYVDYLRIAREDGYNMRLKSMVYPRDAARAHDTLVGSRNNKQRRAINQKLKKIALHLEAYELCNKDLKIVIPKSQKDFVDWGKKLSICVGSSGYDKKMAEGKCVIFGVFMKDEIVECGEILKTNKKLTIYQLRGAHNQASPYHEQAESLANKFLKQYRPQNLIGAVI